MRLDLQLTALGLTPSRQKAQTLIKAGLVTVNGAAETKPAAEVTPEDTVLILSDNCPYVSRGGLKLEAALDAFGVAVAGKICADIGASTGGFSDCLLTRGAEKIYAVDSGHCQLAQKLRESARVRSMEGVNARSLNAALLGERVQFLCCDVSFISVILLLPVFSELLTDDGEAVLLVKPQFEVGRARLGKNGIVRDPRLHRSAVTAVCDAARMNRMIPAALIRSPIEGGSGNREFLLLLRKSGTPAEGLSAQTITEITLGK